MAQQLIETYSKELKEFEDLIKTKSYLPQNIGEDNFVQFLATLHKNNFFLEKALLLRFLNGCNYDLDKAVNLLHKNLKCRKKNPALFRNRDVSNDAFQETRKMCQVFPMPKATAEGYEILIFRLIDKDPGKFVPLNVIRTNVTTLDGKFLTDNELINGSLSVIDLSGFSFRHFLKNLTIYPTFSNYGKFIHQATPINPIRFHIVHCPPLWRRFISFIGPLVRRNYMELAKFHDDFGTIQDTISKELLPNEFGGTAGSIDEIHNNWVKVLESKRLVVIGIY